MQSLSPDLELLRERIQRLRQSNGQLRDELTRELARMTKATSRARERTPAQDGSALEDLTPRELEVLRLIAEGHSTKDVGRQLGIAFKTAACHRHRLMQKLGVHAAGSLVRLAIAAGVVEV